MEKLLGVEQNEISRRGLEKHEADPLRHDVNEADVLSEEEGQDWARQRYRRMYWESIAEGDQVGSSVSFSDMPYLVSSQGASYACRYQAGSRGCNENAPISESPQI